MFNNYIYPKMEYTKNDTSFMYVFFDNGDFLEIKGSEIVNFSINVYDKLIRSHQGFNPVIESGYFKLKICNKPAFTKSAHFLYNETNFKKDRKNYIENRCINEGGITEIWLFDSNYWHKVLHCKAEAKKTDDFLIINFLQQPQMGACSNKNHNINIGNIKKADVHNIDLDFENCESFVVYNDEIEEINLVFDNQLEWGSGDLYRKVIGGYIIIKLDKIFSPRKNDLFDNDKKLKISDFENRLCGKSGENAHDICHLYIDYYHAGYGGIQMTECIEINDTQAEEKIEKLKSEEDEMEEDEMEEYYDYYEGGYCKKLIDNSLIIAFGNNAKSTINKVCKNS